jgi:5-hydroxyisourate hydrolase
MSAKLTTHVLDTASGSPASGVQIDLWRLDDKDRVHLKKVFTNSDGRTDESLLNAEEFKAGKYEIIFHVGNYFAKKTGAQNSFLDEIPVRFGIADQTASYHVPLLVSPWSYSTYRGS